MNKKASKSIESEDVATCACCGSIEIGEKFSGDEGWTVCSDCGAVEQGYVYLTMSEAKERGLI